MHGCSAGGFKGSGPEKGLFERSLDVEASGFRGLGFRVFKVYGLGSRAKGMTTVKGLS